MEHCETIKALRKEFKAVHSGCAGDTIFMAKAVMFLCELAESKRQVHKTTRKPTAWTKFFAAGMKAGKSPTQIGKEWADRLSKD